MERSRAGLMMRYIYLLATLAFLVLSGGCALIKETPHHTPDQVTLIAQSFSPDCRIQVNPGETCG